MMKSSDTTSSSSRHQQQKEKWLTRCLKALHHPQPTSFTSCLQPQQQQNGNSNVHLQRLTLWLENRFIRQWPIPSRVALTSNNMESFLSAFEEYMNDLDCPPRYIQDFATTSSFNPCDDNIISSTNGNDKRNDLDDYSMALLKRYRVVHWLVSAAVSEAFADQRKEEQTNDDDDNDNDVPDSAAAATIDNDLVLSSSSSLIHDSNANSNNNNNTTAALKDFPLGFTTGDEYVDQAVTLLRMKYLLDLRQVQNHVNECIADMQAITIGERREKKSGGRNNNKNKSHSS